MEQDPEQDLRLVSRVPPWVAISLCALRDQARQQEFDALLRVAGNYQYRFLDIKIAVQDVTPSLAVGVADPEWLSTAHHMPPTAVDSYLATDPADMPPQPAMHLNAVQPAYGSSLPLSQSLRAESPIKTRGKKRDRQDPSEICTGCGKPYARFGDLAKHVTNDCCENPDTEQKEDCEDYIASKKRRKTPRQTVHEPSRIHAPASPSNPEPTYSSTSHSIGQRTITQPWSPSPLESPNSFINTTLAHSPVPSPSGPFHTPGSGSYLASQNPNFGPSIYIPSVTPTTLPLNYSVTPIGHLPRIETPSEALSLSNTPILSGAPSLSTAASPSPMPPNQLLSSSITQPATRRGARTRGPVWRPEP